MASFCSKCGAEVPAGAYACTACGAPVAVAAAVPPPAQPVAAVPFQPVTAVPAQAVAAPPPQSNNVVKIILIVVAIFVGLGILGAGAFGFMVWRVAHAIHTSGYSTNSDGGNVTVNTPGGSIKVNNSQSYSADDLGTDIYPGATQGKGGMQMDLPTGKMVTAVYVTSDSKDQVTAFYKSKFGSDGSTFDAPTGTVMTVNKTPQDSVMVTITSNSSENEGKTQITIVHTITKKGS